MKILSNKGFTLIELLIVIAIIGILAVAFLPSLLNAPAKGRDAARIADLQKLQKVLINSNLEGRPYPTTDAKGDCATDEGGPEMEYYAQMMGGFIPKDPQATNVIPAGGSVLGCTGTYLYIRNPNGGVPSDTYAFGLYAHVETLESANMHCGRSYAGQVAKPDEDTDPAHWCYTILSPK